MLFHPAAPPDPFCGRDRPTHHLRRNRNSAWLRSARISSRMFRRSESAFAFRNRGTSCVNHFTPLVERIVHRDFRVGPRKLWRTVFAHVDLDELVNVLVERTHKVVRRLVPRVRHRLPVVDLHLVAEGQHDVDDVGAHYTLLAKTDREFVCQSKYMTRTEEG